MTKDSGEIILREGRLADFGRKLDSLTAAAEAERVVDETAAVALQVHDDVALADPEAGIVTENDLIRIAYPGAIPICTDQFMNVSRDHYSLPWLVREITQNFVDGNVDHPASLDGVHSEHTVDGEMHRIKITGNWPFEKATGLVSLHSGKGKAEGEKKFAGGNGIGLKQTVLRFMRDYGVKEFSITGEGWKVKYKMAKREESNAALSKSSKGSSTEEIENDWLIATVEKSENKEKCSYEIATTDARVATALDDFKNLGASRHNEYLRDPDCENQHGMIKWIPFPEGTDLDFVSKQKPLKGRLFINGQVMNYGEKGKSEADYWDGPEFVSIALNNLQYDMSLDRPPVASYNLEYYLDNFVRRMARGQLLDQLVNSRYLWENLADNSESWNKPACFVLINKLATELKLSEFSYAEFVQVFGDKHLARDTSLSEREEESLKKKGFLLCPHSFVVLGVPSASSQLDHLEKARKEVPKDPDMGYIAREGGIAAGFDQLPEIKKPADFLKVFLAKMGKRIEKVETVEGEEGRAKINIKGNFPEELFYQQMISMPSKAEAKELYQLRGLMFYALKNKIFDEVIYSDGEFYATFAYSKEYSTGEEKLLTKVVRSPLFRGLHVKVNEKHYVDFLQQLIAKESKESAGDLKKRLSTEEANRRKAGKIKQRGPEEKWDFPDIFSHRAFKRIVLAFSVAFGVMGVAWVARNAGDIVDHITTATESRHGGRAESDSDNRELGRWMNSGKTYGESNREGRGKRDLNDLLSGFHTSNVKGKNESSSGHARSVSAEPEVPDDPIENFAIVDNPSSKELEQIGLLRSYIELTTEVKVPNTFFVYTGDGAYGVNFVGRNSIGLHQNLFSVGFDEALSTAVHEVAHNAAPDHGVSFNNANSALWATIHDAVIKIAQKAEEGQSMTGEEEEIIEIEKRWDFLKK